MTNYTTNVANHGEPDLLWAEYYVAGELRGCGPSIDFLPPTLSALCENRLGTLFPGSMLWRAPLGV